MTAKGKLAGKHGQAEECIWRLPTKIFSAVRFLVLYALLLPPLLAAGVLVASAGELVEAGTRTQGGLVAGSRLLTVTTLDDDGPGSLRNAVEQKQPRVIAFKIAGTIELKRPLLISHPNVTIAGQTAPSPGITLSGEKLRIAAQDVVLQHIAVRPTWPAGVPENADAITIASCGSCQSPPADVLLENVSISWGVDENLGLWGEQVARITLRNSIVSEALEDAGHAKGKHSMGMLIGTEIEAVSVVGNVFISNRNRNPVISAGASAYVANNLIHNPGRNAIEIYKGEGTRAALIGNLVKRGPDSRRSLKWLDWQGSFSSLRIHSRDNHCCSGLALGSGDAPVAPHVPLPVGDPDWTVLPASQVLGWTIRHAGSRPAQRDPIDKRLLVDVVIGSGRIIDSPEESTPLPPEPFAQQDQIPEPAVEPYPETWSLTELSKWLCQRHLELGGMESHRCQSVENEITGDRSG